MFKVAEVRARLEELGVNPKKSLGQNFLVNDTTCEQIVNRGLLSKPDYIIEVGPGLGALTERLLNAGLPFTVIELDRAFSEYWRQRNVQVIEDDALRIDWSLTTLVSGGRGLLISNLPYQISSSLVIDRSIEPFGISTMVLMFQKEVAQRIMAQRDTDDYGLLSVVAQTFWNVQFLLEAGPKDFYPPPSIASRVVAFDRKPTASFKTTKEAMSFLKTVKLAFSQRRKMLAKNLSAEWNHDLVLRTLEQAGLDVKIRAEVVSVAQYMTIWTLLNQSRGEK